ncbi:uncharacterized protein LOC131690842 [Topomyia yanbarensis]|uniref:uncharacterized protein LOC131690842 n=1 Tax=Topomyia yanbarensis TaxID=2498891 RepID=UPI00273C8795|nr:uncharacterized protein LOC131690842 [Topomyia yanbarensis]XP_058832890.1 uncharacterized protein LOC131690842 [Topomyia yanbarensis]
MDNNRNSAFSDKLKEQVTGSFDRLRKALDLREKLLLRQLSVVVQQSQHVTFQFDNIKFVDSGEEDLVSKIRTYGKYNIDNFNIILKDPYENEDYIQPVEDHDLMHKSCRRGPPGDENTDNPESEENIVVEIFNNKGLIKEGADVVRESIINLAVNESKELIDRSFPVGLILDDDIERMKIDLTNFRNRERTAIHSHSVEGEGSRETVDVSNNNRPSDVFGIDPTRSARQQLMITKASQTELDKAGRHSSGVISNSSDSDRNLVFKTSKQRSDKTVENVNSLTVTNCSGTINLKNVTNLTINACPEVSTSKPAEEAPRCSSVEGSPECGFYKRLITENKILRQHILNTNLAYATNTHSHACTTGSDSLETDPSTVSNHSSDGGAQSECSKTQRPPLTAADLRNILNLPQQNNTLTQVLGDLFALASPTTAVAAAAVAAAAARNAPTSTHEHTMQIQQWLKQIISETETEPQQNVELMEFSQINN